MASPLNEFEPVLNAFLGTDNAARAAANQYLLQLRNTRPDTLLLSLLQSLRGSRHENLRQLSAVLIRKSLFEDDEHVWSRTSAEVQGVMKAGLLQAVQTEPNDEICRMVCDTIGEVGQMILHNSEWPEVLQATITWASGTDNRLRASALNILQSLALYVADNMQEQFGNFNGLFQTLLADSHCPNKVKIEAVRAASAIVVCCDTVRQATPFRPLIPHMITLIKALLASNDAAGAHKLISCFIDVADTFATWWKPQVADLVSTTLAIAGTKGYPDNVRQLAVEVCLTLAQHAGPMVRKLPGQMFLKTILPVLFGMMLEQPAVDTAQWDAKDEPANRPCTNFNVGREGLQRVGQDIGAATFLPTTFAIIATFLSNSDWKYRHAALIALSEFTHLLPDDMGKLLKVCDQIIPFTADADVRVQYAALTALGMICMDQQPAIQLHRHEAIIPAIQRCMKSGSIRVRAHAAGALINFLHGAFDELLEPYVDTLLADVYTLLANGPVRVQEYAMNALATLADTCTENFDKFYDKLMPVLRGLIARAASDKALQRMRGRAFECIGIMGAAVPVEKFKPDAVDVMRVMAAEQATDGLDASDPQRSSMWTTWGRIALALKGEFAPYLSVVMPSLLAAAAENPLVKQVPREQVIAEAAEAAEDSDDSEVANYGDGDVVFRVRTAALDDKSEAVNILKSFADSLGAAFHPYVAQSLGVLMPILDLEGEMYDDVKGVALGALPSLLGCESQALRGADRSVIPTLLQGVLAGIFKSLEHEKEVEMIDTFVQAIKYSVERACENPETPESKKAAEDAGVKSITTYTPLLTTEQLSGITRTLAKIMQDAFNRRAVRRAEATVNPDDYDSEEEERIDMLDSAEHMLHFFCVDCFSTLFKTHRGAYLPVFEEHLFDRVMHMADPACVRDDQKHGVFVLDDVIEFGGEGAKRHLARIMPVLTTAAASDHAGVAQGAVYGLGVAGVTMGAAFAPFADQAVQTLAKVVNKYQDATEKDYLMVHDNTVTAMGKIMGLQKVSMLPELVAFWLSRMPLQTDKGESRVAIRQLCARIESNCPATLQANNLAVALSVFAKVVSSDKLCTEALARFIMAALHHLKAAMPAQALGAVWGTLPASEQAILTRFMSDPRVGGGAASPVRAAAGGVGSPQVAGRTGAGAGAGAGSGSPFA